MVKGISRRVIVVKSPDPRFFDEAIFIVREDAAAKGVTGDEILKEAQAIAEKYVRGGNKRGLKSLPPPAYLLAGAGITAIVWLLTNIVF